MDIMRLTEAPIDVNEALAAIADPACGAQAFFLGLVRNEFEGRASAGIFYDAYVGLAEKELVQIGQELKAEFDIRHVVLIHRVGDLPVGTASVLVAVASGHRPEAFRAAREGIDRIKARVPIWKQEHWANGTDSWHDDPSALT